VARRAAHRSVRKPRLLISAGCGTKGEAKEYAAEAKEYVQGAVQHAKEYVEGAREYIGDSVQQARDKVSEYRDGGVEKVRHDVMGYTREQPMTALLIAAGAGLVLGWLSAGRR
jgi:ElaB/YqjD/DUF883 family membrane-anchored ribosome-binding protein